MTDVRNKSTHHNYINNNNRSYVFSLTLNNKLSPVVVFTLVSRHRNIVIYRNDKQN